MFINLFDEKQITPADYAKKIIREGYAKPFYNVTTWLEPKGVSIDLVTDDGEYLCPAGGLYVIYRETEAGLECLYVGHSYRSCNIRIYRFMKELAGRSHPMESHPAARKARHAGVKTTDRIRVKTFHYGELEKLFNVNYFDANGLDEYIAVLLKSRFNKRVRY